MANYLITGGAGFIGSHIVETLIKGGERVRVLDDLSTGRRTMLPRPKSPYAVSKMTIEHHCRVFTELFGLETVGLRYFNVFGPRQDPTSEYAAVIPKFITTMLRGEAPTIYGDGTQSRDFTYVSNVVAANLLATTAPDMAGRVFNAAVGIRYTLLELVAALNEILDTRIEPLFAPPQPGDVKHSQSDISLIEGFGYQVEIDFLAGLQRTVERYAANGA